jgi:ribosome maturation factor RimP
VSARADELQQLLEPVVTALGYELWGIEVNAYSRHTLLRVYIDSPTGITVDDCATVSRQVGSTLDVSDPLKGSYTLEVSSPGWDRPLFTPAQYARYVGEPVALRLAYVVDGKRNCNGRLVAVHEEQVEVELSTGERSKVPFAAIKKARLAVESQPAAPVRKRKPRG